MDQAAILEVSLSFFLVITALALAYVLVKIGGTFSRLNIFLKRLDEEVIPLISKLQVTMDEVNGELKRVDDIMAALVDVTDRVENTTRAMQLAIATPVKKVAGISAGVSEALSSLWSSQRGRS